MVPRSSIVFLNVAVAFAACTLAGSATAQVTEGAVQTPAAASGGSSEPTADTAQGDDADAHGSRRTDHFRLGALGGVGFPRPLAVEGMIVFEQRLALGVEYSCLPTMTISSVDTSFWAVAGDARIFPFGGGFFVGVRAGHQRLSGSASFAVPHYRPVNEAVAMDTTFVNPRIGFLWTLSPGISVGINAGVQIPLSVTASNTLPAGTPLRKQVDDVATSFGRNILPTIDLLQIGLLL